MNIPKFNHLMLMITVVFGIFTNSNVLSCFVALESLYTGTERIRDVEKESPVILYPNHVA